VERESHQPEFDLTIRHRQNGELSDRVATSTLELPEVVLVGPRHLRTNHEQFLKHMKGDSIWFNVCLSMYRTQALFDALLRPAIENPTVLSIQFILDSRQKDIWRETILPKINACTGHEKVYEPRWCSLEKNISFILADSHASEGTEALLSFWGEPFMAEASERQAPRFIFHVQKHSELLPHLVELDRCYRRSPVTGE